ALEPVAAARELEGSGRAGQGEGGWRGGLRPWRMISRHGAAATTSWRRIASPPTHCTAADCIALPDACAGCRCKARTCQPFRKRAVASSPPMPPVAPNTRAVRFLVIAALLLQPC